jgi:excinuclease UvrABC nuclease subunit
VALEHEGTGEDAAGRGNFLSFFGFDRIFLMPKVSPLHAFGTGHRVRHPFEGKTDTRRRRKLKDVARTLPRVPGVYFFYGFNDRLLYIGKAKCLRERVRSYFAETSTRRPPKLRRLLAEIKRLEWQECGSELEALLVERRLIAERLPILNRQHKRFVVYPYLLLSDEAFPRFTLTRAEPLDGASVEAATNKQHEPIIPQQSFDHLPIERAPHVGELPGLYLGPFTSPRVAAWTFEAVRSLFPLRSCEGTIRPDPNGRACFYHEIGRCCGPCVGTTAQDEYSKLCNDLLSLLQSGQAPQLDAMRARMQRLSDEWRFEEAVQLREQLAAIEAVAKRLQRLQRMRREHNVVIAQPGPEGAVSILLVQSGVVRRNFVVRDWGADEALLKRTTQEVYSAPPQEWAFTAKTELDEMMILDRWLRVHRDEPCCIWVNDTVKTSRQWASNVVRGVKKWHAASTQT